VKQPFLPFALPEIGQEEIDEVSDTLKSGWLTTGPKTARFEREFAEFLGTPHALAVNSGTAGLDSLCDSVGWICPSWDCLQSFPIFGCEGEWI
jgi:dTDP-4-amino-4,6-dideoxygalactose transaminase